MKEIISILLPTRGRPEFMEKMILSAVDLAKDKNNLEFILYMDFDDYETHKKLSEIHSKFGNVTGIMGTRTPGGIVNLSMMWNECYKLSKGDIAMHAGDDLIFRTQDWDKIVKDEFNKIDDRIAFVFGDDGNADYRDENNTCSTFGTHGFLHRNWVQTVGYFVPPYFSSNYNDTWLNEVGKKIKRHVYVDILTEHIHPSLGKVKGCDPHNQNTWDQTHTDRILRTINPGPNIPSPDQIWSGTSENRRRDAERLLNFINNYEK